MKRKGKIATSIASIVAISTMIILCVTSYAWFTYNKRVSATGLTTTAYVIEEDQLHFDFDLYKHDAEDFQNVWSGYKIDEESDGSYKLTMNSYDSIFENLNQCGIVMRAKISKFYDKPFTGNESFTVSFVRDSSQDGDGSIFSAKSSSVVEIQSTLDKPAGLADDESDDSKVYENVAKMFYNGSYTGKTFANISTHKKNDVAFTFAPDASRNGKTSIVLYFYITYNMPLVTTYQNEHYTEIDPLADKIFVESDIVQFRLEMDER